MVTGRRYFWRGRSLDRPPTVGKQNSLECKHCDLPAGRGAGWGCTNNIILPKAIILWFRFFLPRSEILINTKPSCTTPEKSIANHLWNISYTCSVPIPIPRSRIPDISQVFQVRSFDIRKINISRGSFQFFFFTALTFEISYKYCFSNENI